MQFFCRETYGAIQSHNDDVKCKSKDCLNVTIPYDLETPHTKIVFFFSSFLYLSFSFLFPDVEKIQDLIQSIKNSR